MAKVVMSGSGGHNQRVIGDETIGGFNLLVVDVNVGHYIEDHLDVLLAAQYVADGGGYVSR